MRGGDLNNWRRFACRPIISGDFVSGGFRSGELRRSLKTTQLVLSQLKNFLTYLIENRIRSLCAKNKQ